MQSLAQSGNVLMVSISSSPALRLRRESQHYRVLSNCRKGSSWGDREGKGLGPTWTFVSWHAELLEMAGSVSKLTDMLGGC